MDAQELGELATNALTGHWPKHLGVNTDAERIEFLARKLEAVAGDMGRADIAEDRVEKLEEEVGELKDEIEDLETEAKRAKEIL